jgi:hypothetical protein
VGDTREVNGMANWNCHVLSFCIVFWRDRLTERKEGASIEKESRHQAKKKRKK